MLPGSRCTVQYGIGRTMVSALISSYARISLVRKSCKNYKASSVSHSNAFERTKTDAVEKREIGLLGGIYGLL